MANRSIIIVRRNDAILLQLRTDGKWELPGGKFKSYDSAITCAKRELLEETGLVVLHGKLLGIQGTIAVYECLAYSGIPSVCEPDKQVAIGWFEELPNLTKRTASVLEEYLCLS
jgi:8-oxo-dGTP pyrophosphatase MutT (NUDIX family)